ncbi:hypothetical protein TBLA_0D01200 [Henningerozyma blattae CBS 6284]|uniref:non-specific serine/threonine protein kinase n=1 Tax=Henningerozyma blattae (strain ATCC 34711 / CBS 6284 / DSM 70876 / NBRC 10599 / NRRL Y-10934 / UCD 77-7) TaxID=1071380 RepID=I2H2M6_HENB6|nr:hypothetical protein TBLA_0D01200 [Tetrapisispora blattae CBS 6284]CCH60628.1 hypothetical protein TBLA_0D01200 [Tetrapisispora blattae CBS 6284]
MTLLSRRSFLNNNNTTTNESSKAKFLSFMGKKHASTSNIHNLGSKDPLHDSSKDFSFLNHGSFTTNTNSLNHNSNSNSTNSINNIPGTSVGSSTDSLQSLQYNSNIHTNATTNTTTTNTNSMADLKKFFIPRNTNAKNDPCHEHSAIPPSRDSSLSLSQYMNIYHDDTILFQKYGKLGKLLGEGAGGSVKIIERPTDHKLFAVKKFKTRKQNESIKVYSKKCTSEYLMGSILHHQNIITTLDIFADSKQSNYYLVMEYCPIDFFSVVMSGKLSRGEINCYFKQLNNGVIYLHSKGIAHRDLKLDNCVMTENGIIKIIDFGSSLVFKYPDSNHINFTYGIVGSDPYLPPEVLVSNKLNQYDPRLVDIWSIGIIYCCMMLKRFPWKIPDREKDKNFNLFSMQDDFNHDYVQSAKNHELLIQMRKQGKSDQYIKEQQQIMLNNNKPIPNPNAVTLENEKPSTIHGPYRLLRLLPHASRPIISKILSIDPSKRATFDDIIHDQWFQNIQCCNEVSSNSNANTNTNNAIQNDNIVVKRVSGHHHTIVKDNEKNGKQIIYKV